MHWNVICKFLDAGTHRPLQSAVVEGPFKSRSYAELLARRQAARYEPVLPVRKGRFRADFEGYACRDRENPRHILVYGIHGVRKRPAKPKPAVPDRRADIDTINSGLVVAIKAFGGNRPKPDEDLQRRIRALLARRCPGWDISMGEDGRPKRWEDPIPEMRRAAERYYELVAAENGRVARAAAEREEIARLRAEAGELLRRAEQASEQARRQDALRTILATVPSVFRSVPLDGSRWFVTKDIIRVLHGITRIERCANTYAAVRRLPEEAKRVILHEDAKGRWTGIQSGWVHGLALISGEGLIAVIRHSTRPAAKPFKEWAWGRVACCRFRGHRPKLIWPCFRTRPG